MHLCDPDVSDDSHDTSDSNDPIRLDKKHYQKAKEQVHLYLDRKKTRVFVKLKQRYLNDP